MITRALVVLMFALLAWLPVSGTAMAQNRGCTVEQAPPLDFGYPASNPTVSVTTSTAVTVRCTGNGSEGGETVLVCIKLDPSAGLPADREMASGVYRLGYQIRGTSPTGPVIAANQTADGLLTMDQGTTSHPYGVVTIPLYGEIAPGQTGLGAGTYSEAIRGEVRSSINPDAGCGTLLQAVVNTSATAILLGSCSIVADDLAFGSHSSLAGGISGTANIQLTCTTNTSYAVRIDGGSSGDPGNRSMRRNGVGPETISYGLYRDASHTQPWGNTPATTVSGVGTGSQISIVAYGLVPGAQPPPLTGDYQDTVAVTVEY